MIEQNENSTVVQQLGDTVKACAILADTLDDTDLTRAGNIGKHLESVLKTKNGWAFESLGMIEYRRGQFAAAINAIRKSCQAVMMKTVTATPTPVTTSPPAASMGIITLSQVGRPAGWSLEGSGWLDVTRAAHHLPANAVRTGSRPAT